MKRSLILSLLICQVFSRPVLSLDIRPLEVVDVTPPGAVLSPGGDGKLAVEGQDSLVFLLESEVLPKSEESPGAEKIADVGGHYIIKSAASAGSGKKVRPFLGGVYNEGQRVYGLATGEITFKLSVPNGLNLVKAMLPNRKIKCIGSGQACFLSVESMTEVIPTVRLLSKVKGVSDIAPRVIYNLAKPLAP